MTDRLVTLTVWILAAGFALACVVFAWRAAMPVAAPPAADGAVAAPGEQAWQVHCARCHAASEFTGRLAAPDRETAAGRWLAELERHGGASFSEDLAILHWLSLQTAIGPQVTPDAEPEPPEEDDFTL